MPVLEAMACGIPVACSKEGALPEMAGPHALFFSPDDVEDTASALERIVTDQDLRVRLVADGLEWTRRFTWKRTATRTMELVLAAAKG